MAVKFIDRNRKGEVLGDEIVVRCDCGCGFITISAIQEQDYITKEKLMVLDISHFGGNIINKRNSMAQEMVFVDPEFICAIGNLINCDVNNGNGVVEDENGRILMIDHSDDQKIGKTLCLADFYDEKSFRKYMKNPQKGAKYLSWNIILEEKEMNKFADVFNKLLQKEFCNEVCEENRTGSGNEEAQNN